MKERNSETKNNPAQLEKLMCVPISALCTDTTSTNSNVSSHYDFHPNLSHDGTTPFHTVSSHPSGTTVSIHSDTASNTIYTSSTITTSRCIESKCTASSSTTCTCIPVKSLSPVLPTSVSDNHTCQPGAMRNLPTGFSIQHGEIQHKLKLSREDTVYKRKAKKGKVYFADTKNGSGRYLIQKHIDYWYVHA